MTYLDIDKLQKQLNSGGAELPEYETIEDLSLWMKAKRKERRRERMKLSSQKIKEVSK